MERITAAIPRPGGEFPGLFVGLASGRVVFIRIQPLTIVRSFEGLAGPVVSLHSSGPRLIAASPQAMRRWGAGDGSASGQLLSEDLELCRELPDGSFATVSSGRKFRRWIPAGSVGGVTNFRNDESVVGVSANDFEFRGASRRITLLDGFACGVWDLQSRAAVEWNRPVRGLELDYLAGYVGLSAGGGYYFTYWDDYLVLDTTSWAEIRRESILFTARTAALSPDSGLLLVAGENAELAAVGANGEPVWQRDLPRPAASLALHDSNAFAAYIDCDGGCGVIACEDGRTVVEPKELADILSSAHG